jgi:hypothetical protein
MALMLSCLAVGGCGDSCLNGNPRSSYVTTPDQAGKIVAPDSLGLPDTLARASHGSCGANLYECLTHPEICSTLCVQLQSMPGPNPTSPQLMISIAMGNLPYAGPVTLPRPDTNVTLWLVSDGLELETLVADSGTVFLTLTKNNVVVLFDISATTANGDEITIQGGRYADLDGRMETTCDGSS